jgi:hypothetical protein
MMGGLNAAPLGKLDPASPLFLAFVEPNNLKKRRVFSTHMVATIPLPNGYITY